jgi:CelD/BcsL family acetyltransferase involved in cellulose biosynthesis
MLQTIPHSPLDLRPGFATAILHSASEFDDLKDEWNDLLERSDSTVFQSFEWQRSWWRFFGETNTSCQLFLVVIRQNDRLVAVAPLFVERLSFAGLFSIPCLRLIGREVTDYLNIICERNHESSVAETLVGVLVSAKSHFDVVALEDIPHSSQFHQPLFEGLLAAGFVGSLFQNAQCPRTALKETWESTLESFSKKHKKDISYELRNVYRNYSVELEVTAVRSSVLENVEDFIAMHQERWVLAGHPGVFRDTQQADFHRHVALQCFDRGWLFLTFLKLNGRRVAVNYGFRFRQTLSTYLNGMIELGDMAKFSPGKVLHELSMQEGIKEGMQVYDFMRGRERYKYALNAVDVPNWAMVMYRDGSQYAKSKFSLHLLTASLKRRFRKEITMLRHVADEHGWVSSSMGRHLSTRLKQNTRDSVQKVKEPEKSLE